MRYKKTRTSFWHRRTSLFREKYPFVWHKAYLYDLYQKATRVRVDVHIRDVPSPFVKNSLENNTNKISVNWRITKDEYDNKLKSFKGRQQDIVLQLEDHTKANESFYLTASQLLDVAKRAYEIFESSEVEEKRQLLNFLLQNCQLDDRNLLFKMKTPFDTVLSCNTSSNWLRGWMRVRNYTILAL